MSDVSVVVPLYNEEQSVAMLQRELADALTGLDYEIIFVDDGSQDETGARIAANPRTRVLHFEKMPDKARLFSLVCRRSAARSRS